MVKSHANVDKAMSKRSTDSGADFLTGVCVLEMQPWADYLSLPTNMDKKEAASARAHHICRQESMLCSARSVITDFHDQVLISIQERLAQV